MPYRVAVIGNCQAFALARCLELLVPDAHVAHFSPWGVAEQFATGDQFLSRLAEFDIVCVQPDTILLPGVDTSAIRRIARHSILYPNIQFSAFHPDLVYAAVHPPDKPSSLKVINSAIGDYSSALIVFGYMYQFSEEKIFRLFNPYVFERLGYFSLWKAAEEALFRSCHTIEFPIEDYFYSWARRGCFMRSINHPVLFVMEEVARFVADRGELRRIDVNCSEYIPDPSLLEAIFPVYPEVGKFYGTLGAYLFKKSGSLINVQPSNAILDLNQYVRESLKLYRSVDPNSIICPRPREWRSEMALFNFLNTI